MTTHNAQRQQRTDQTPVFHLEQAIVFKRHLVEVDAKKNISYQDTLIVAMKRERAAFQLYSDMAEKVPEGNLKDILLGLAKEKSKHKLFFESEYDDRVMKDN